MPYKVGSDVLSSAKSLILRCDLRDIIHMPKVRLVHIKHLGNLSVNGETRRKNLSF